MAKNIITSLSDISQSKLKQLNEVGLNTAMNIFNMFRAVIFSGMNRLRICPF